MSTAKPFLPIPLLFLPFLLFLFLGLSGAEAATIYVPDNYATIQDALGAAASGDTVVVRDGTYVENIEFPLKEIVLMSENGPDVTVIDGNRTGRVMRFAAGLGSGAVLDGFTLTNGQASSGGGIFFSSKSAATVRNNVIAGNTADKNGGGICCFGANPKIADNVIRDNSAYWHGGGISCAMAKPTISGNSIFRNATVRQNGGGIYCNNASSPLIIGNRIEKNSAHLDGAGIYCGSASSPRILNNIIAGNDAYWNGGGICCRYQSAPTITNNSIVKNSAHCKGGGGIGCLNKSSPTVQNTIVWNNTAPLGHEIAHDATSAPDVSYCDVKGGWVGTGNIQGDPLFVNSPFNDFHLTYTSPCRDSGDNMAESLPSKDFEGDKRTAMGTVDMGADEFHPRLYCLGCVAAASPVRLRLIGLPGAWVMFSLGSGVLDPPVQTKFGLLCLQKPSLCCVRLGTIPADGVLRKTITTPTSWTPGTEWFSQAMLGPVAPYQAVFTNLFAGVVR